MSSCIVEPTVEHASLVALLRMRAACQANQRACAFLVDGEREEIHLTYGELDARARAIAAWLQQRGLAGQRALLLYRPGLDYIAAFFGCLYAGVVAVPAYPPDLARMDRTLPRLRAIVEDAQPAVAMTTAPFAALAAMLFAKDPRCQALQWLATDSLADGLASEWQEPVVSSATLAFLQYTSGSTSAPKGVMVTHGNLLHNSSLIYQACEHTPDSRAVSWLPPYHDMGLIGTIIHPIHSGFPVILMSPLDFLQRPIRWLQAISHYQATTSGGPNFAYDLCVRKTTPEQRATLDLSSWSVAFNGAEPVRAETLDRFTAAFAPCGFRRQAFFPCYGLAEATLIVSGASRAFPPVVLSMQSAALSQGRALMAEAGEPGRQTLVGCGLMLGNQRVMIVNPDTSAPCGPGEVGEIWISGPSVAKGYWNRPEETEATFHAHLAWTTDGSYLRTGDLGFIAYGELFVTGRRKDLIIVEGCNHYPQDIELTVERCHPALRPGCCAAFSINGTGPERLVVAVEVDRRYQPQPCTDQTAQVRNAERAGPLDSQEVVKVIRQAVALAHDLRVDSVSLLRSGSIPKTSSGKIQRHACRAGFLAGTLDRWEA
jgi:acyl-CoA synthetase (AMP-forming)/AMP-acid ligase II